MSLNATWKLLCQTHLLSNIPGLAYYEKDCTDRESMSLAFSSWSRNSFILSFLKAAFNEVHLRRLPGLEKAWSRSCTTAVTFWLLEMQVSKHCRSKSLKDVESGASSISFVMISRIFRRASRSSRRRRILFGASATELRKSLSFLTESATWIDNETKAAMLAAASMLDLKS